MQNSNCCSVNLPKWHFDMPQSLNELQLNSLQKQKVLQKVLKMKFTRQWEYSLVLLGVLVGYLLGKFLSTPIVYRESLPNWINDGPSALSREFITGILNSPIYVFYIRVAMICLGSPRIQCSANGSFLWYHYVVIHPYQPCTGLPR